MTVSFGETVTCAAALQGATLMDGSWETVGEYHLFSLILQ